MPSTSAKGITVKAEAMAEVVVAKAKARINIDLNQKADPQATVPTVAPVTLPQDARHLEKNATIATKTAIFPRTVDLNNVVTPHPNQNLMVLDNHDVIYMI